MAGPSKAGPATCVKGGKGSPGASKLGLRGPGAGARPFPAGRDGGGVRRPLAEGPRRQSGTLLLALQEPRQSPPGEDEAPAPGLPQGLALGDELPHRPRDPKGLDVVAARQCLRAFLNQEKRNVMGKCSCSHRFHSVSQSVPETGG